MIKHKKMSAKSNITIPKDLRTEAGMVPGMAVELESQADGSIIIRRHVPVCRFCGSPEIIHFENIDICRGCAAKLGEAVKRHD